jgi:hypothetical protein
MTVWKRKQRFSLRRGTINDKRGTKFIEGRVNAARRYDRRGTKLTCSGHGYG